MCVSKETEMNRMERETKRKQTAQIACEHQRRHIHAYGGRGREREKSERNFKRRGDKLHAHVMENLILSRQLENS